MPAPRKLDAKSPAFLDIHAKAVALKESKDCSVKALAIVTGRSYEEAHEALRLSGRKARSGADKAMQREALLRLGFVPVYVPMKSILETYPGKWAKLPTITTHHPVRIASAWAELPPMLLFTSGHVTAFRDGRVHDWTEGRAKRVVLIWKLREATEEERAALDSAEGAEAP